MTIKYRLHLILIKVDVDPKNPDEIRDSDILEEDELIGYREDFDHEVQARRVYSSFTGNNTVPCRTAEAKEVKEFIEAYWQDLLSDNDRLLARSGGKPVAVAFDYKDAEQIQIAIGLHDLKASIGQITEVAVKMGIV